MNRSSPGTSKSKVSLSLDKASDGFVIGLDWDGRFWIGKREQRLVAISRWLEDVGCQLIHSFPVGGGGETEPLFMDDTHGGVFGTGDGAGLEMVRRIPTGYCFNRYDLDTGWFNTIIGEDMDDGKT